MSADVSTAWPIERLSRVFAPVSRDAAGPATVLSVYRDYGVIPKASRSDNFNRTPEDLSRYQLVLPGDLVVNRMKAWQGSLGISAHRGIVSPDYEVLSPTSTTVDSRFMHALLRSRPLIDQYAIRSTGIRPSQWRLYWAEMRTIAVQLPPLTQQCAIADYLDRETARTDTLIDEQQRLVGLLHERHQAILSGAFDRRGGAHTRLRHVLRDRPTYGVLVPRYVDYGAMARFIRVGDLPHLNHAPGLPAISASQSAEYARTELHGGEVLLGVVGRMGQSTVAPTTVAGANVARAVAVLRCMDSADAPLLNHWLSSRDFLHQAHLATSGDTVQPTLGMADLANFQLAWPRERNLRARLTAYIDEQTARIDALIAETERFIELSKERRAALITAAVTGQIDVRNAA